MAVPSPVRTVAQALLDDQTEAREVIRELDGCDLPEMVAGLRAALDSGDPNIADLIYDAKGAAGWICGGCSADIYPDEGHCSDECARWV